MGRLNSLIPFRESEASIAQKVIAKFFEDLTRIEKSMKKVPRKPRKFTNYLGKVWWFVHLRRVLEEKTDKVLTSLAHIPCFNIETIKRRVDPLHAKLVDTIENMTLVKWYPLKMRLYEELLRSPVFIEKDKSWKINFSKEIQKGIVEIQLAIRGQLDPDPYSLIVMKKVKPILENKVKCEVLLWRYKTLTTAVEQGLRPMFAVQLEYLYQCIETGASEIFWSSPDETFDMFDKLFTKTLDDFEELIKKVTKLRTKKLQNVLQKLASVRIVHVKRKQVRTVEEFTSAVDAQCQAVEETMQKINLGTKKAVNDLMLLVTDPPKRYLDELIESLPKQKSSASELPPILQSNICLVTMGHLVVQSELPEKKLQRSSSLTTRRSSSSGRSTQEEKLTRAHSALTRTSMVETWYDPSSFTAELDSLPSLMPVETRKETSVPTSSNGERASSHVPKQKMPLFPKFEDGNTFRIRSKASTGITKPQKVVATIPIKPSPLPHKPTIKSPKRTNLAPPASGKRAKLVSPKRSVKLVHDSPQPTHRPPSVVERRTPDERIQDAEVASQRFLLKYRSNIQKKFNKTVIAIFVYELGILKNCLNCSVSPNQTEPTIQVNATSIPKFRVVPTSEELQETIMSIGKRIVSISKHLTVWEDGMITPGDLTGIYSTVYDNKEIMKALADLLKNIDSVAEVYQDVFERWGNLQELWQTERESVLQAFLKANPSVWEFENEFVHLRELGEIIMSFPDEIKYGGVVVVSNDLKQELIKEVLTRRNIFGNALREKVKAEAGLLWDRCKSLDLRLQEEYVGLEGTKAAMDILRELRNEEADAEIAIVPIEDAASILAQAGLPVSAEDTDVVRNLRYQWYKLQQKSHELHQKLVEVQPMLRKQLLKDLKLFRKSCRGFYNNYQEKGPMVPGLNPKEASDRLSYYQDQFEDIWKQQIIYSTGAELFGIRHADIPELLRVRKELNLLQKLYKLYNDVVYRITEYHDIFWPDVNIEAINNELVEFQLRCRKLPKGLKEWPAFQALKRMLDDLAEICPLLELMSNKAMKLRHWKRLSDVTGHTLDVNDGELRLKTVISAPLLPHKEDVEDICISALKERDIEAKLGQVTTDWASRQLLFLPFKARGELLLRGDATAEIMAELDDSLMVLTSLVSNRYNAPFRDKIQHWVSDLSQTNEVLERWLFVQNLWVYLEAVFVGGDIARQLPKEAERFQAIDTCWQNVMARAHEDPNVVTCCVGGETLIKELPRLQEELEVCQKSLAGYLEKKRLIFPRFFFVSDPALLEILGQASDSHTIQSHLLSIFDNTASIRFHEQEYNKIMAIVSSEGEIVNLEQPVLAEGSVEVWLNRLLQEAQRSLHGIIRMASQALLSPDFRLLEFLNSFPAQVGILGLQMLWTREAEQALLHARHDKRIMQETNTKFLELLNILIEQTTRKLSPLDRTKFETFITLHVHQRDIFDYMCRTNVRSLTDFEWIKQFRFYFKPSLDKTWIALTDVHFSYQNEFLGCTERLVVTPLTDRCYITLAQALHMCLGGCPAGPAGTGKTETVKDMGKILGKYVVVFNCSDQMDFRGLGRIFKGLAQSGSWGCFDEFNRIDLPVLSVAAQQVATVLACKREKRIQFTFTDGDVVDMNPEFGIFLTMNPDYAGRQRLPENLKQQFRQVAMMVPDRQIIIRVKLASCGFLENITLARKFYTLYKLCEEQLTKQVHYDFGLRNILSVLRTLGAARRANPREPESTTVMRVLRDMNLSKLVDEDEPLFLSLINDLFPTTALEKTSYPELEAAIEEQVRAAGLLMHPPWVLKLIQLYETQLVRHGVMVLGPSGAGKTACIQILMKALTAMGEPHREMRMNPKAISASQMFGRLDVATNDWTDGIFSALWRRSLRAKKNEHIWLVLDGPVDAIWIENLNSVLDDNRTLTLANGDRLPMGQNVKIIFEPHNIDNASPATVSRNGMVYMSSSGLDWSPLVQTWLARRPAIESAVLGKLFRSSFASICQWSRQNLNYKMEVLEYNTVSQALILLEGLVPVEESQVDTATARSKAKAKASLEMELLSEHGGRSGSLANTEDNLKSFEKEQAEAALLTAKLEKLYVFVLMWSVGALLEREDRLKLENYMRKHHLELAYPTNGPGTSDSMFDFMVDEEGNWRHWEKLVEPFQYPECAVPDLGTMLVPNVDSVRTNFLLQTVAKQGKAVLLIGEPGSAKTVMIENYTKQYNIESDVSRKFSFSYATSTLQFQRTLEGYIDKRTGSVYGPPAGKKLTIFIDDLSLPAITEWGDQPTNEALRQVLETNGLYSLDKPGDFLQMVDIQFVAAMSQPGGGRNDVPSRLKRHFCIFNCPLPSEASMDLIYGTIAGGHYALKKGYSDQIRNLVLKLVPVTRQIWTLTKQKMLPTPSKSHYVFNLRDLSRIWQGVCSTVPSVVETEEVLMSLWKHECMRVIADRFVSTEDEAWFEATLTDIVRQTLGDDYATMVEKMCYFVDFMRDAPEPTGDEVDELDAEIPKIYEPADSGLEGLENRLKMYLSQYNEIARSQGMDLVFFKDAVLHAVKISRILRHPGGHVLLVGVGGSGKQSLTKLASFIAGYKTFQITLTRSYNVGNFLEDLKILYRTCGIQGKGTTFIFTDNDIKEEGFLEYLNSVLSSGSVSSVFNRDEMADVVSELLPVMKREQPRRPPTPENVLEFFQSRVRTNLHVALCFSPVSDKFRTRALKFPGLVAGCTIDWFHPWPKEALISVAHHILADFPVVIGDEVRPGLEQALGCVQDSVTELSKEYFQRFRRAVHVTPKTYLGFLGSYKTVVAVKAKEVGGLARRMDSGLGKLEEAAVCVAELKEELAIMDKQLVEASQKAEQVLIEVEARAKEAEATKDEVQKVKDKAQVLVQVIQKDKVIAEGKLEEARPALEEAEAALNTIKPAHISTIRKLGRPPHLIMRIMDCVMILFQRKLQPVSADTAAKCIRPSWNDSLKFMASATFLSSLQNFPKDTITDEMIEFLEPYFRAEDYDMDTAKRVCGDVAGLLSWTKAMGFFFSVNKEVLPLKANLALQESRLKAANRDLRRAERTLWEKEQSLKAVTAQYQAALTEKEEISEAADVCRRKMAHAEALISGLSGEKVRWTSQSKAFKIQLGRLLGDGLLATAFLSYAGPFSQAYRGKLQERWRDLLEEYKITYTVGLNVVFMLVEASTTSEWNLQGLPNDDHSIQNAAIATRSSSYPLLIDPQGQGKNWLKMKESSNELQITSMNHKYFRTHLEDSLSLGRPLLIEDIGEELDPVLDNLLEKRFIKTGTLDKVIIGDKDCDVMPGFMLYITTKLSNPAYTPEICAKTALIDFTVTQQGLEDQLLGRVVLMERSELEAERVAVFESVLENKRMIKELEDNLLARLTAVEGSLIDDDNLLIVLNQTKKAATEIAKKLEATAAMEKRIDAAREAFRPVAARGSLLYFLVVEMTLVSAMYQTSLKQFLSLFDVSVNKAAKSANLDQRVSSILKTLTLEVWRNSLRGFYTDHKPIFTLLLALKVDLNARNITHKEFMTLIKGGASLDIKAVPPKPFRWLLDITWLNIVSLSSLPQFGPLPQLVSEHEKEWKHWLESGRPELATIPCSFTTLDSFRKLLLIRAMCTDRMAQQARIYITEALGVEYNDPPLLDLDEAYRESDTQTPLICLLSAGADPTHKIEALARQKETVVLSLSMGQGQEVPARNLLTDCMNTGRWLLLQNCHLSLSFCRELLELMGDNEAPHQSFRLWLTTEPHPQFPIVLLQFAVKFTNEPPRGIRSSLKTTYADISQDFLDYSVSNSWPPLLFALAFLHTTLQERRKYGPLGWNVAYEFSQADFQASIQFLQNHLDDPDYKKGISWQTVCFMLGEVQYGGRVTDDFDKRLLVTFTQLWFGDRLVKPGFDFHKDYNLPQGIQGRTVMGCIEHINSLPHQDSPEVLGLHPNADITYQMNVAQGILDTILSVQPKEGEVGGEEISREETALRVVEDLQARLPRDFVSYEVKEGLNRLGTYLPMTIFLRQEISCLRRVMSLVRNTLSDLKLAIEGTIVLSPSLRDALDAIADSRVPASWKKEVTRAHKGWALDSVVLQSLVTRLSRDEISESPPEGVYVHGLYLEGASLDRRSGKLIEARPKALYDPMPVLYIYAVQSTAGKDPRLYECPIYRKPQRSPMGYIGSVDLDTDANPKLWTLRGVALLCDIQ